jgi:hypothetical protein
MVLEMLSRNIVGWADGNAGALKSLHRATAKIRALPRPGTSSA